MASAIILDFDGTLADTVGSIWVEYQRVMRVLGLRGVTHREFTRQMGKTWEDILRSLWPGIKPGEFTGEYDFSAEEPKPFPGVNRALGELRESYVLAVMTSRGEATLRSHMAAAGLGWGAFEAVYYKGNLMHNKPDPRALTQVCSELDLRPSEAIYVGDSVVDAECALKAGLRFIAVLSGGAYEEDFGEMGVTEIIGSVAELPTHLKESGE